MKRFGNDHAVKSLLEKFAVELQQVILQWCMISFHQIQKVPFRLLQIRFHGEDRG